MANTNPQPAGEQPPAGSTTAPTDGGAQPQSAPQEQTIDAASISTMNEKELRDALFNERPASPQPAPAETAPRNEPKDTQEAPTHPQDTTAPDGEQPPAVNPPTDDTAPLDPSAQGPERISLRSLPQGQRTQVAEVVRMIRSGEAASVEDALRQIATTGDGTPRNPADAQAPATQDPPPAPTPDAPPANAPPPATAAPDPEVARISSVLADLREQRDQADREYDRPAVMALTRQIEDAIADLSEAKAAARIQAQQQASQNALVQSAVEEVYLQYPEAEDPDSFFSYRLNREMNAYERVHGSLRNDPRQLLVIADRVAKSIGNAPQAAPAATPAATPQNTPAPRQELRPLGVAAPGNAPALRPSREQTLQQIQEMTVDDLRSSLWGPAR